MEAKAKENTAEREGEKVSGVMILFKALDPASSPNPTPPPNLLLIKPAGIAHTEFIHLYLFNKRFIVFPTC